MTWITGLYVPGDRPDRFDKAVATGADLVVLDLQDAVPADRKTVARDAIRAWFDGSPVLPPALEVRVESDEDLAVVAALPPGIGIRLPDVTGPSVVDRAAALVPGRRITALVEDARGLLRLAELAAHPAVTALGLGESDLRSDLRLTSPAALDRLRLDAVIAARAAGLPAPMMSVYPAIPDLDGLRTDSLVGRSLGMRGRMAVHPTQLPVIRKAFAPTREEQAWAREVLSAAEGGGASRLSDGTMVDPAMLGRARDLLP